MVSWGVVIQQGREEHANRHPVELIHYYQVVPVIY